PCRVYGTTNSASCTLSLHAAVPICDHPRTLHVHRLQQRVHLVLCITTPVVLQRSQLQPGVPPHAIVVRTVLVDVVAQMGHEVQLDRKSTRLNSSHVKISYAVFCLKK